MTSESWNIGELKTLVESFSGLERAIEVSECTQSICSRVEHAQYHLREFSKAEDGLMSGMSPVEFFAESFNTDSVRIFELRMIADASAIAAAQAIHSLGDILAATIYFSLHEAGEWKGYFSTVKSFLPDAPADLFQNIDDLTNHPDYEYLRALVNRSKHTNVVTTQFKVHLDGIERNLYLFNKFDHKEISYTSREVKNFLAGELKRQNLEIITIGNRINSILKRRLNIPFSEIC